jgi:tRNA A-37 threonylcarbamoyl transferase component Bud32
MAAAPTTPQEFLQLLSRSRLVTPERWKAYLHEKGPVRGGVAELAERLEADGVLTHFQALQLLAGRWRGFFLGPYRILDPLAEGGFSRVFLAEHTVMRRRVALKVTSAPADTDLVTRQRWHREGRAIASLDHPNVVRVFDMGAEGPLVYLAMEFVQGESLADVAGRGPLPVRQAADCIRQAALGLQHAHDAGWVHRDVKPSNLLLTPEGVVKLLDLGLARPMLDPTDNLTRTYEPKHILGTLDYLSPEQIQRFPDVDGRSDVYSLGATFYFLLAGRPPFDRGMLAEKLLWHLIEDPQPIRQLRPAVPEALAAVLRRMLAKDPNKRHQRPSEVAEDMADWLGKAVTPRPSEARAAPAKAPPQPRRREARAGRRLWLLLGGAGLALAAAAVIVCALVFLREPAETEPPALSPQEAAQQLGQRVTLEMKVRSVGMNRSGSLFYLNSEEDYHHPENFTIVLPRQSLGGVAPDVGSVRQAYLDRRVRAVGVVIRDRRIEIENAQRLSVAPEP